MNSIELTEQQEEKLLKMCKDLFTQHDEFWISYDYLILANTYKQDVKTKNSFISKGNIKGKPDKIHWFEFCYKHLAQKVLKNNYYKLTAFTNLTIIGNVHPIDYLHQHYKSQQ